MKDSRRQLSQSQASEVDRDMVAVDRGYRAVRRTARKESLRDID